DAMDHQRYWVRVIMCRFAARVDGFCDRWRLGEARMPFASGAFRPPALATGFRIVAVMADEFGQMFDGVPRVADGFGKRLFSFVIVPPAAVVVHLDEMSQGAPGAEELQLGIVALSVDCNGLRHGARVCTKSVKIRSKPPRHGRKLTRGL